MIKKWLRGEIDFLWDVTWLDRVVVISRDHGIAIFRR